MQRGGPINTLGMPKEWQRWFDRLKQQGVTGLGDNSAGEARGMFASGASPYTPTFDPQAQRSAVIESGPSNAMGGQNASLDAIFKLVGGRGQNKARM